MGSTVTTPQFEIEDPKQVAKFEIEDAQPTKQPGAVSRFLTRATGLPVDDIAAHPGAYLNPFSKEYWQKGKEEAAVPAHPPSLRQMVPFGQTTKDIGEHNYAGALGDIAPGVVAAATMFGGGAKPVNKIPLRPLALPESSAVPPVTIEGTPSIAPTVAKIEAAAAQRPPNSMPYRRVPGEVPVDDVRGPQQPNFTISRPRLQLAERSAVPEARSGEPQFLSDQETADYGMQGGLELPTPDEATVANSDRMLNQTRNWRNERALYDPLSYQEGPTPEQAQATRDFFHSPLKNWNGDPIAVRSNTSEYAPADLSQDLTPALEESLRRVRLAKERAGATKKVPTRGEK